MSRLIITADDFGLAEEVNEAVEIGHVSGILSAASLMVAGPAAHDALARARRMPDLRVGLHLVLVDEQPLLPAIRIPHLVTKEGRLRSDLSRLGYEIAMSQTVRDELRMEIEAQFAAFQSTGLPLDHVNAHKHFHLHPIVAGIVMEIGSGYGMRSLRVPREPANILRQISPGETTAYAFPVNACAAWLLMKARRAGFMVPDHVFGLRWSGGMDCERLKYILVNAPPGLVEIYLHAAVSDDFPGHAEGYRYTDELAALTAIECRGALYAARHDVGGYADAWMAMALGEAFAA